MSVIQDSLPAARLEFTSVAFARGERQLFDGLSFTLSPGQLLWITGENGIGKTSILKLALNLWKPTTGTIKHLQDGIICAARDVVSYLGHIDAFEPLLTAHESLDFWAEVFGNETPLSSIFEQVGLSDQQNLKIGVLSAGQKRRLAFARLILARRPIWILDEPKAALDHKGQDLIEALITAHLQNGGSALVATHDQTRSIGKKASRIVLEPAI